jgi:molybdenum cofactor biosynthesis enzyme MoaA
MLYHITTLDNFARGYDKYTHSYGKENIAQSHFPGQFFLLKEDELSIGVRKTQDRLNRMPNKGNAMIALGTDVPLKETRNDHATGLGQYVPKPRVTLSKVYWVRTKGNEFFLEETLPEELMTHSLLLVQKELFSWQDCKPRSWSVLPIAFACQAKCKFCFSKASVSFEHKGHIKDWNAISQSLSAAKKAKAERAVITGGGEPTLLKPEDLLKLTRMCSDTLGKTVLITNGARIETESEHSHSLKNLHAAGLDVLSVSHHHHNKEKAKNILGLDVDIPHLAKLCKTPDTPQLRLICVLQKEGVASAKDVQNYLKWAASLGITQVTFKELYVSTTTESAYAGQDANVYSRDNQVSLKTVTDCAAELDAREATRLPWGAPVFETSLDGQTIQFVAYTEPSVMWERTHGLVRSWNHMSNGTTLASLEDIESKVDIDEFL